MTHSSADTQRIDWSKVESYLRSTIPDLPDRKMKVKKFSEGYSNLTYLLQFGDWEGVLRRPPFGYVPPKAHDMSREYRCLVKFIPFFLTLLNLTFIVRIQLSWTNTSMSWRRKRALL